MTSQNKPEGRPKSYLAEIVHKTLVEEKYFPEVAMKRLIFFLKEILKMNYFEIVLDHETQKVHVLFSSEEGQRLAVKPKPFLMDTLQGYVGVEYYTIVFE